MFHNHRIKFFVNRGILLFVAILLLCSAPQETQAAPNFQGSPPPQPTNISVTHRSGQTFLTWSEVTSTVGEKYRIYRHTEPVTSGNLNAATLILEVGEGSSRFFANRYFNESISNWSYRFTERFVIQDLAPPLNAQTGLLVWTLGQEDFGGGSQGSGYYAVTTVSFFGVENRTNFNSGNTTGAVAEAVGEPEPVEINHNKGAGWHVYIQYMDLRRWNPTFNAPNNLNSYYGFSANDVQVMNASQYAYDYAVYEPGAAECGGSLPQELPVVLSLHGYKGNNKFEPVAGPSNWCAYQIYPVDVMNTWWFGFAQNYNYRTHQPGSFPGAGDTIVNYTEQRLLRMIADLERDPSGPNVDLNRVYVQGHSMGGSGSLSLAVRYGNVFAAADASKPMTNYRTTTSFFLNDISLRWGKPETNLPVVSNGPRGWAASLQAFNGTSVWDWQNHQATLQTRQADLMAPFGITHSLTDSTMVWNNQGKPAYVALNASRQVWGGEIRQDLHKDASFMGLPPNLANDANNIPFAGMQVRLHESMPGLSNGSANLPIPPSTTGNYNHAVMWSSSWYPWDGPPVETASSWEISLCSVNPAAAVYTCGTGVNQTIDVTPRRLQLFHPAPGATLSWENRRVSDGGLVASGMVTADANGIVTVPGVAVSPSGVRLRISSGSTGPSPTSPPASPTPTLTHTPLPPTPTPTPLPVTATHTPPPTATHTPPPGPTSTNTPVQPPATQTPTQTNIPPNTPTPTNTAPAPATATNTPGLPAATATNTAPPPSTPTAGAGDTGWHAPSVDAAGGGGDRNGFEVDTSNFYTDDGLAAADMDSGINTKLTCNGNQEDSHHFYNFDFSIPAGATVTGIEARLDGWTDSTAGSPRFCVQFSWNNGGRWSEYRVVQITQTSETSYITGGPALNWGHTWSPAEFNNGSFRMRIIMDSAVTDRDFFLDWTAVKVHYQ